MSEFELVSLLALYNDNLMSTVGLYASMLFGFTIAIFFAGPTLPRWVLLTITVIYSLFSFLTGNSVFTTISRAGLVREELAALDSNTTGLVVQGLNNTAYAPDIYILLYVVLIVGSYLGSIAFLVYVLRNKKEGHAGT